MDIPLFQIRCAGNLIIETFDTKQPKFYSWLLGMYLLSNGSLCWLRNLGNVFTEPLRSDGRLAPAFRLSMLCRETFHRVQTLLFALSKVRSVVW
jgi:hypothetical protein